MMRGISSEAMVWTEIGDAIPKSIVWRAGSTWKHSRQASVKVMPVMLFSHVNVLSDMPSSSQHPKFPETSLVDWISSPFLRSCTSPSTAVAT
jgi:hypothetical protein